MSHIDSRFPFRRVALPSDEEIREKSSSSLRGKAERGDQAVPSRHSKSEERRIYAAALGERGCYLRDKRVRILSEMRGGTPKDVNAMLREGMGHVNDRLREVASGMTDFKLYRIFKPDHGERSVYKTRAKSEAEAQCHYLDFSDLQPLEKRFFYEGTKLLDGSYQGIGIEPYHHPLPEGHRLLTDADLPLELSLCYDNRTGILQTPSGCKALLVRQEDGTDKGKIRIIFAGTEAGVGVQTGRKRTLYTDMVQRFGGYSRMYHDASAVTRLIMDHPFNRGRAVECLGHSLGGGLAQYAVATNIEKRADKADKESGRLTAMTYNSAGLSASALGAIGEDRIRRAAVHIRNVRAEGDPVSPGSLAGSKAKGHVIGRMWTVHSDRSKVLSPTAHSSDHIQREIGRNLDVEGEELDDNVVTYID